MKLVVGIIALSLAPLTSYFADSTLTSISASYHEGGWSQAIFIGFLFAISAFLLAYNGRSLTDMYMSKTASALGLGVALFPCDCGGHEELVPYIHYVAAAIMFLILAYFCYGFLKRAWGKGHHQARARAAIYALCGIGIVLSCLVLAVDGLLGGAWSARVPRLAFYGEATGLVSFGVSWLVASHAVPIINRPAELYLPFRAQNPE